MFICHSVNVYSMILKVRITCYLTLIIILEDKENDFYEVIMKLQKGGMIHKYIALDGQVVSLFNICFLAFIYIF